MTDIIYPNRKVVNSHSGSPVRLKCPGWSSLDLIVVQVDAGGYVVCFAYIPCGGVGQLKHCLDYLRKFVISPFAHAGC